MPPIKRPNDELLESQKRIPSQLNVDSTLNQSNPNIDPDSKKQKKKATSTSIVKIVQRLRLWELDAQGVHTTVRACHALATTQDLAVMLQQIFTAELRGVLQPPIMSLLHTYDAILKCKSQVLKDAFAAEAGTFLEAASARVVEDSIKSVVYDECTAPQCESEYVLQVVERSWKPLLSEDISPSLERARAASALGAAGSAVGLVLRLLFGKPLDQDDVRAIARMPALRGALKMCMASSDFAAMRRIGAAAVSQLIESSSALRKAMKSHLGLDVIHATSHNVVPLNEQSHSLTMYLRQLFGLSVSFTHGSEKKQSVVKSAESTEEENPATSRRDIRLDNLRQNQGVGFHFANDSSAQNILNQDVKGSKFVNTYYKNFGTITDSTQNKSLLTKHKYRDFQLSPPLAHILRSSSKIQRSSIYEMKTKAQNYILSEGRARQSVSQSRLNTAQRRIAEVLKDLSLIQHNPHIIGASQNVIMNGMQSLLHDLSWCSSTYTVFNDDCQTEYIDQNRMKTTNNDSINTSKTTKNISLTNRDLITLGLERHEEIFKRGDNLTKTVAMRLKDALNSNATTEALSEEVRHGLISPDGLIGLSSAIARFSAHQWEIGNALKLGGSIQRDIPDAISPNGDELIAEEFNQENEEVSEETTNLVRDKTNMDINTSLPSKNLEMLKLKIRASAQSRRDEYSSTSLLQIDELDKQNESCIISNTEISNTSKYNIPDEALKFETYEFLTTEEILSKLYTRDENINLEHNKEILDNESKIHIELKSEPDLVNISSKNQIYINSNRRNIHEEKLNSSIYNPFKNNMDNEEYSKSELYINNSESDLYKTDYNSESSENSLNSLEKTRTIIYETANSLLSNCLSNINNTSCDGTSPIKSDKKNKDHYETHSDQITFKKEFLSDDITLGVKFDRDNKELYSTNKEFMNNSLNRNINTDEGENISNNFNKIEYVCLAEQQTTALSETALRILQHLTYNPDLVNCVTQGSAEVRLYRESGSYRATYTESNSSADKRVVKLDPDTIFDSKFNQSLPQISEALKTLSQCIAGQREKIRQLVNSSAVSPTEPTQSGTTGMGHPAPVNQTHFKVTGQESGGIEMRVRGPSRNSVALLLHFAHYLESRIEQQKQGNKTNPHADSPYGYISAVLNNESWRCTPVDSLLRVAGNGRIPIERTPSSWSYAFPISRVAELSNGLNSAFLNWYLDSFRSEELLHSVERSQPWEPARPITWWKHELPADSPSNSSLIQPFQKNNINFPSWNTDAHSAFLTALLHVFDNAVHLSLEHSLTHIPSQIEKVTLPRAQKPLEDLFYISSPEQAVQAKCKLYDIGTLLINDFILPHRCTLCSCAFSSYDRLSHHMDLHFHNSVSKNASLNWTHQSSIVENHSTKITEEQTQETPIGGNLSGRIPAERCENCILCRDSLKSEWDSSSGTKFLSPGVLLLDIGDIFNLSATWFTVYRYVTGTVCKDMVWDITGSGPVCFISTEVENQTPNLNINFEYDWPEFKCPEKQPRFWDRWGLRNPRSSILKQFNTHSVTLGNGIATNIGSLAGCSTIIKDFKLKLNKKKSKGLLKRLHIDKTLPDNLALKLLFKKKNSSKRYQRIKRMITHNNNQWSHKSLQAINDLQFADENLGFSRSPIASDDDYDTDESQEVEVVVQDSVRQEPDVTDEQKEEELLNKIIKDVAPRGRTAPLCGDRIKPVAQTAFVRESQNKKQKSKGSFPFKVAEMIKKSSVLNSEKNTRILRFRVVPLKPGSTLPKCSVLCHWDCFTKSNLFELRWSLLSSSLSDLPIIM